MGMINALAISIGVLAAIATYLCLGTPLGLQVWALFVGWGAYYHSGGKTDALTRNSINHAWGVLVAAVTLVVVGSVAGSVPVTSAIVGLSVVVLVLGAHLPVLATIPAAVSGYASTAAFALLTGVAIADAGATLKAAAIVLISLVIGNVFGLVSEKAAGAMTRSA
jgi:hypothetical protein